MNPTVDSLVRRFNLLPHPEGGFYAEIYRAREGPATSALPARFSASPATRSFATGIYFLMTRGNFSAFHRIASDEGWHFYDGDALIVHVIHPDGRYEAIKLGRGEGETFQAYVPHGAWFASESLGAYSFVGCTVAPGFEFADFELAKRDELIKEYPQHAELITRLTRVE